MIPDMDALAVIRWNIRCFGAGLGEQHEHLWVVQLDKTGSDIGETKLLMNGCDGSLKDLFQAQAAGDQPPILLITSMRAARRRSASNRRALVIAAAS